MTLRRITGLLLTVALAQLSLGAVPYCASRDMAAPGGTHEGMSMPGGGSHGQPDDQSPQSPNSPCDHGPQGPCATMTSCATLAVEAQVVLPPVHTPAFRAVSRALLEPVTVSLSLDTPPPRA